MPEIGWFSSTREEDAGRRGHHPKAVVSLTWPYACGRSRRPSASGEKRPPWALQEPPADENLSISGRCPPVFLPRKFAKELGRAGAPERTAPHERAGCVSNYCAQSSRQSSRAVAHIPAHARPYCFNRIRQNIMFSLYFCHVKIRKHLRDCHRQPRVNHLCAGTRS